MQWVQAPKDKKKGGGEGEIEISTSSFLGKLQLNPETLTLPPPLFLVLL